MDRKRKKLSFFKILLSLIITAVMLSATACNLKDGEKAEDNYKLKLPVEEMYALNRYTEDTLSDVMVTMRRDIFKITERNLLRPSVQELSDTFTYTETETGQNISATFHKYPNIADGYDLAKTYKDTLEGANFYKYMLLRQGEALRADYQTRYLQQTISQSNLYKHPGIDEQFGAVKGTDNAVKSEIIIDPSYRSLHTTGLYMPAGELLSFKVEGLKKGESVNVVFNRQSGDVFNQTADLYRKNDALIAQSNYNEIASTPKLDKVNRLPILRTNIPIQENKEVFYGNPFGGIIHIDIGKTSSPIKITITGAVETPHYILGVTTPEYFETYLKTAPGVISALDTENGILIGPGDPMKNVSVSDIENLALLWHSYFSVNESFTGGPYNANNLVTFDRFVPAGAAVHLGGGQSACPSGWYNGAMSYQGLLRYGSWGILHEIGHGNGSAYGNIWGLGGNQEGEVRNNAIIALCYLMFGDMGTYHGQGAEHGFVAHPYDSLNYTLNNIPVTTEDYNSIEYFGALSTYTNLMHSFGTDKFYELTYSYKANPKYCDNKRADFIYRCGLVYGFNFTDYFNDLLHCNVTEDLFSEDQLAYIKSRPQYIPIANYYAGGINGIKTGGDNLIVQRQSLTLDLKATTISPNEFSILKVNQPKYGSVTQNENGTYTYKTASGYYPTDQFNFTVKQANSAVHTFTVSFRIQLTGSGVERYENVNANSIDAALAKIENLRPASSFYSKIAGIPAYSAQAAQGKVLDITTFTFMPDRDGDFNFYLKADDIARLLHRNKDKDFAVAIDLPAYAPNYNENKVFTVSLKKGVPSYFKLYTLNSGGLGFSSVGMKNSRGAIVDIPASIFFPSNVTDEDLARAKNYQPPKQNFLISKKDNILSGAMVSNKSEWEVISAPNAQDGNTYVEKLLDEKGDVISEITRNKTNFILDGFTNTEYHSVHSGANRTPMPHVYTVDMKLIQPLTYYKIFTRNNVNSYIKQYELFYSADNVNYTSLSKGDNLEYKNLCATLNFDRINARYLKLIIYSTTGQSSGEYFSVLTEIDAGTTAKTERIAPATSSKLFMTKGWKSSDHFTGLQSGMVATDKKNEKMVIKFTGDKIALYSTVNSGYGAANIFIDGKKIRMVNLDASGMSAKQLIFTHDGLKNGEHTLEIVTTKKGVFNVGFIGLSYSGTLVSASNIYLEKALTIAMIVFISLFLLLCLFILLIYFVPPFRRLVLSDRLQAKLEKSYEQAKINRENKRREKKTIKSEETKKAPALKGKPTHKNCEPVSPAAPIDRKDTLSSTEKAVKLKEKKEPKVFKATEDKTSLRPNKEKTAVKDPHSAVPTISIAQVLRANKSPSGTNAAAKGTDLKEAAAMQKGTDLKETVAAPKSTAKKPSSPNKNS